jgi:hypothetical protein
VRLEPISYERDSSSITEDNNWVKTKVTIRGGSFTGQYIASMTTYDFDFLKQGLSPLYDNLKGGLLFNDLENALELKIQGDGIGHFSVDVTARDNPGPNYSVLTFTMAFDQTELKTLVEQITKITKRFPVIGDLNTKKS